MIVIGESSAVPGHLPKVAFQLLPQEPRGFRVIGAVVNPLGPRRGIALQVNQGRKFPRLS